MAYNIGMTFLETSIFTKRIVECLTDAEYAEFQDYLMQNPEAGDVIQGTGGLRKIRWKGSGRGKRGGTRIIYYWWRPERMLMLYAYLKKERADLTRDQLKLLAEVVKESLDEND